MYVVCIDLQYQGCIDIDSILYASFAEAGVIEPRLYYLTPPTTMCALCT